MCHCHELGSFLNFPFPLRLSLFSAQDIYQKALSIVENFFGCGDEDENLAPNQIDGQFAFGQQAKPVNMDFGGFGQQTMSFN